MLNKVQQNKYEVTEPFSGVITVDGAEAKQELTRGDIFEVVEVRSDADGNKIAVVCKPGLSDYLELPAAAVQTNCRPLTQLEFMQRDEKFGAASWNYRLYQQDDLEDDCAD
ncbi:hypothetical protein [Lacticaseibacillus zhaodongensis]|uniref:hypothetical protein n=1 Tax=Lacticaseibacillus zhaodongensis TaxID=2668065 RepID=UPI0012D2FD1F|nr:hypothetical protein [Lacticaseibacillus zhaodongensis]